MAIAVVQEFTGPDDDRGTTNYDGVSARLNAHADPPVGLILHTAGFTGTGVFRIFGVWESEADWQRFHDERLMPAVMQIEGGAAPPTSEYTYELHDVVKG